MEEDEEDEECEYISRSESESEWECVHESPSGGEGVFRARAVGERGGLML